MSVKYNCARQLKPGVFCELCRKAEFDKATLSENKTWLQASYLRCSCHRPSMRPRAGESYRRCSRREFEELTGTGFNPGNFDEQPDMMCKIGHVATSNCPICTFLRKCSVVGSYLGGYALCDLSRSTWNSTRIATVDLALNKVDHFIYALTPLSGGRAGTSSCACHDGQNNINYGLVKDWLTICDAKHPECLSKTTIGVKGMQLIDCYDQVIVPFNTEREDYIALSYVWGTSHANDPAPS
jgi:hypothetical protein